MLHFLLFAHLLRIKFFISLDDLRLPIQARPVGAVDGNGLVEDFDASDDPEYVGHENGENGQGASEVSSFFLQCC